MTTATHAPGGAASSARTWGLMLAALGVVYGDIGTSPLYAIKECFSPESPHHVPVTAANILGVLSLMFWSLMMVVTVKYLTFITRADNEGAGGILALLSESPQAVGRFTKFGRCLPERGRVYADIRHGQ